MSIYDYAIPPLTESQQAHIHEYVIGMKLPHRTADIAMAVYPDFIRLSTKMQQAMNRRVNAYLMKLKAHGVAKEFLIANYRVWYRPGMVLK